MQVERGPDSLKIEISGSEPAGLSVRRTVPGVVVDRVAAVCGPGTGTLILMEGLIQWKSPGSSSFGAPINISSGGSFRIPGSDEDDYLIVTAYADYLADDQAEIVLGDLYDVFADQDIPTGSTEQTVTTLTLTNRSKCRLTGFRVWVDATADDLEISLDDISYSTPTTEATGLILPDLGPGDSDTLYTRHSTAVGEDPTADLLALIHLAFNGI